MGESINQLINRQRDQIGKQRQKIAALEHNNTICNEMLFSTKRELSAAQCEIAMQASTIRQLQELLATKSNTSWMQRLKGLLRG